MDLNTDPQSKTSQLHTKIDTRYVSESTDIIELFLENGVDLIAQANGDYVCLCPFHDDEETPSLHVYTSTNSWYCFGCQRGSSVFDFVMFREGVEFQDALLRLAARVGYTDTYVLKSIRDDAEGERFSAQRDKIELAISKKYSDIYRRVRTMNPRNPRNPRNLAALYDTIEEFWTWYDSFQSDIDSKLWGDSETNVAEDMLFSLYGQALTRLERIGEI